jgi:predicted secreted Zn-dependent protease
MAQAVAETAELGELETPPLANAGHSLSHIAILPSPPPAPEPPPDEPASEEEPSQIEPMPVTATGPRVQCAPDPGAPPADPGAPGGGQPPPADPMGPGVGGGSTSFTVVPSTRVVSGKTLTEVWNAMTNSGAREAASVLPKFTPAPQYEYDAQDRVTKVVVTVVDRKEMPAWKELPDQCPPIRAEWDRYYGVLDAHEDKHVGIDRKHFTNVHLKLVGKKRETAWKVLDDEIAAADQENQAYDTQSQNGVKEGAKLNAAVQCAPEKVPNAAEPPAAAEEPGMLGSLGQLLGGLLQAKLTVSVPGDALEREADEMAERVSRGETASPPRARGRPAKVHRCGGPGHCECDACQDEAARRKPKQDHEDAGAAGHVHRAPETGESSGTLTADASARISSVVGRGSGGRLDPATRGLMEGRFGHDFGSVRVHTDREAAESALLVRARAYTLGADIVFAAGQYAPGTEAGRRLLAHELTHVVQQGAAGTSTRPPVAPLVQRDGGAPPPDGGAPPAPSAPDAANGVEFTGTPLSPITKGMLLTPEPERIHAQLRAMIIDHGATKMSEWVGTLHGALFQGNSPNLEEEQKKYGKGDVSGAPDPQAGQKQAIATEFDRQRKRWETTIDDVKKRFDEEMVSTVTALLDSSEKLIHQEATRYGFFLDPTGNKIRKGEASFLPMPPERKGLKDAAREILTAWHKRDRDKKLAQALLTSPWDLLKIDQQFDTFRRDKIQQYPALAAFARNKEKLQELVAAEDPAANLEKEMNQKLDNIAWVKARIQDHKNQLKLDARIRGAAKRGMLVPKPSVEDRVIEDQVQGLVADKEFDDKVKTALGFGLLILSFVPGGQGIALAGGAVMMGADLLGKFEDYLWEEAASGTALDRAAAISQSDPSLFRLGMEIAIGLGQGAVEAAAIGKAVQLFKALAPVVREAVAARVAARAARTAATTEVAAEALSRVEKQGGASGKQVREAIEAGRFDKDAAAIGDAASVGPGAKPGAEGQPKKISGIPDAFSGGSHDITITRRGNIRCSSPYCMELADSIMDRLEGLGLKNITEEQRAQGSGLAKRAAKAREEAAGVKEGTPEETALAEKVEQIEKEMVGLEREAGRALRDRLGVGRNYPGELQAARDRIGAMRERHQGKAGYGEMQKRCDELADEVAALQSEFDKIQRDLEIPGQSREQLGKHSDQVTKLLHQLDEVNKKLGGVEREQYSQLQALDEGGSLYGKTDQEIRDRLGERLGRTREQMANERISDLVSPKPDGSWIVTESKGGEVDSAFGQLTNTIRLLVQAEPRSSGRIDARMTVTREALERLGSPEGHQGYCVGSGGQLEIGKPGASRPARIEGARGGVTVQAF